MATWSDREENWVSAAGNAPWPIKGNWSASFVGGARQSYFLRYGLHFFRLRNM